MHQFDNSSPGSGSTTEFSALTFDPAEFSIYVAELDLSEYQQRELLETVWTIMVGFVDLGFRIHPVQQVLADDAQISVQLDSAPVLDSGHSVSTNASTLADRFEARAAGRTDS